MGTCSECDQPVYAKTLCHAHYQKARYHQELPAPPPRPCEHCGQMFTGRSLAARFCSRACIEKARTDRRRQATREALAGRRCQVCSELIPDTLDARAKFCSRECGVKWQNRQHAARKHETSMTVRAERSPCPRCGAEIPLTLKVGTIYCSKNCQQLAWNERTGYMRQYLYGIDQDEYEALLAAQDGRCAVCGNPDWPGKDNRPHVDHCHATGKVRGLLCGKCNIGIGQLDDDPVRLRAAADYLDKFTT